ncbi:DinB family protein [Marinobacter salicampi]|uniref:DinB family protein n=1 Tax=Marinobacter salicampi TaxID=435907 RepID=UPI00140C19FE|nr:DinB family protein [Marinobacter salicampi]
MSNSNSESSHYESLVAENTLAVSQLVDLLVVLPDVLYKKSFGTNKQHVIGKHVRHIIDHYIAFLAAVHGQSTEALDYENRRRDERLELDNHAAGNRLIAIASALNRITDVPETALPMVHISEDEKCSVATSIKRELAFLASHTIHHMAIIAMLAERGGVEVSENFGVHPSTLRHQRKLLMSARKCA